VHNKAESSSGIIEMETRTPPFFWQAKRGVSERSERSGRTDERDDRGSRMLIGGGGHENESGVETWRAVDGFYCWRGACFVRGC
jgi:hypothetical protein